MSVIRVDAARGISQSELAILVAGAVLLISSLLPWFHVSGEPITVAGHQIFAPLDRTVNGWQSQVHLGAIAPICALLMMANVGISRFTGLSIRGFGRPWRVTRVVLAGLATAVMLARVLVAPTPRNAIAFDYIGLDAFDLTWATRPGLYLALIGAFGLGLGAVMGLISGPDTETTTEAVGSTT